MPDERALREGNILPPLRACHHPEELEHLGWDQTRRVRKKKKNNPTATIPAALKRNVKFIRVLGYRACTSRAMGFTAVRTACAQLSSPLCSKL